MRSVEAGASRDLERDDRVEARRRLQDSAVWSRIFHKWRGIAFA